MPPIFLDRGKCFHEIEQHVHPLGDLRMSKLRRLDGWGVDVNKDAYEHDLARDLEIQN
jgi:hypothetical protein